MRAYLLVARIFGRLRLVSKTVKERLCNFFLEIGSRKLADHPDADVLRKGFVPDAERIKCDAVVQEFDLQRLVGRDPGCGVKRDGIPGSLDTGGGPPMMLHELADSGRA